MGGTYAGNAVACAAAVAAADAMKEENILANVNARSEELFASLNALRSNPKIAPTILDVRGKGLMVGVEFASPTGTGPYDPFANPAVPAKLATALRRSASRKAFSSSRRACTRSFGLFLP
ncbi:hypothetical protein A0H81_09059 [Grifola frondosa]|uniref:Uncharacterized protein n=1 Tax=Grifola frondosa TaxID=5627 RepID=A0A1C7M328_GRIFR|nr:hypothetical protein A0H81_09059 [Grifola frondosa]